MAGKFTPNNIFCLFLSAAQILSAGSLGRTDNSITLETAPVQFVDKNPNIFVSMMLGEKFGVGVHLAYKEGRLGPFPPFVLRRNLNGSVVGASVEYWITAEGGFFVPMEFGPHAKASLLSDFSKRELNLVGGFRFPLVDPKRNLLPVLDFEVGCRGIGANSVDAIAELTIGAVF